MEVVKTKLKSPARRGSAHNAARKAANPITTALESGPGMITAVHDGDAVPIGNASAPAAARLAAPSQSTEIALAPVL